MAKSKTQKTKKPTGLSIKRSGNTFTLSWKIGDADYGDGQYFQRLINDTGKDSWLPKKNTDINKKSTSKSIKINKKKFYPYKKKNGSNKPTLYEIGMRVKGNRKKYTTGSGKNKKTHSPGASDWSEKRFVLEKPRKPSLSVALDDELTNVCKFSWSTTYNSTDAYMFTDVQWQTILKKNCSESDGSKISWKGAESGSAGASSYKIMTEDTSILYKDNNSYTRWFRVRSRGPRGASDWVYKRHVYALPNKAGSITATAKETDEGGFQCIVTWKAGQSDGQKPIDKTTVQYSITVPDEKLTCPNGASWTDANISKDTSDEDAATFSIDDQLSKDQCLFIRVNTQHDSYVTYGRPVLASVGYVKDPTDLSVQTDNVTHKAIVSATNASDIEDSVLVVRYVPAKGDSINCGIIPHNASSVTVTCPNWDDQSAIKFEVYAMVGSYKKQSRTDGVDSYSITSRMRSENTVSDGGAVPVAPQNVSVNRVEGKSDTIRVTWDWPWSAAGSAEIAWSDHDDAWESTDEPETYLVNNLHASQWNISGLETGKTWYVRVRLIKGNVDDSENVTYGPWSSIEQGMIDLSSAPNKPSLAIANPVLPQDGSTVASWVYTSTDNTEQAYAEVAVIYDVYAKTTDAEVLLGKEYYTVVGTAVASPDAKDLNLYYELNNGIYIKTQDTDIVSGKTYYTIVATRVESPATASIGTYYEVIGQLYSPIVHTLTTQHVTIDADAAGFTIGNIYNLACRVKSESGRISEWSDMVSITLAEPLECVISQSSLIDETIAGGGGDVVVDQVPYNLRASGGGKSIGTMLYDKIVGGTVAWNQQIKYPSSQVGSYWTDPSGGSTVTDNNGSIKVVCTGVTSSNRLFSYSPKIPQNHVGFQSAYVKASEDCSVGFNSVHPISANSWENQSTVYRSTSASGYISMLYYSASDVGLELLIKDYIAIDLTQMFGSTIADYIYSLEQALPGAGVAWFRSLFPKPYYEYNAGELISVNTSAHNTVGKNLLDPKTYSGLGYNIAVGTSVNLSEASVVVTQNDDGFSFPVGSNWGMFDFCTRPLKSGTYRIYIKSENANSRITVYVVTTDGKTRDVGYNLSGTGTINTTKTVADGEYIIVASGLSVAGTQTMIAPQIEFGSTATEYEEYSKQSYPLDSSLTLRGIPKLDASNNLYYDGDTYMTDGMVTRRFNKVTFDNSTSITLNSSYSNLDYAVISGLNPFASYYKMCLHSKYPTREAGSFNVTSNIGCILPTPATTQFWIGYPKGTSLDTMKADLIGTELVYEITPTTETAEPYTNPQEVDPSGTEEYVDERSISIPVGHYSEYAPEDGSIRKIKALDEMPLTVTAEGAGIGGVTAITIKRAESYYLERPNEDIFNGHKDEVIATKTQIGQAQMSFDVGDLIGSLDDGATYKIIATIKDGLGQTAQSELDFEVRWAHQAAIPSATVEIDETDLIAKITPTADDDVLYHYEKTADTAIVTGKTYYTRSGAGTEQSPYVYTAVQSPSAASLSTYYEKLSYGDVADIYRLSIDKPELIVQGAEFGQTYVDPYPALGDMGGYRIVLRTKNGDYITPDNEIASVDSPELGVNPIENEEQLNIIDFEGRQIRFYYNTDYSYTWAKDFQESQYMGGSIKGDWNAAVSRTGTLSTLAITVLDQDMLQVVRRLAEHPGICHVRTADGSSYAADVQVSEDRVHTDQEMLVSYSLTITRVDSEGFDGMTLEQYIAETEEQEE